MPTFLSGFSGGGLADVGAVAAGFTPIQAIEYREDIAEVYAANLGNHVHIGRVQEVDWRKMPRPDLAHVSPVCKQFSNANASGKEGEEELSQAEAIASMIRILQPNGFTLENVTQYRTSRSIEIIRRALAEGGYSFDEQNVNSADFGVPQTRRRFILRAVRKGSVPPLKRTHVDLLRLPVGMESLFDEEYDAMPWNGWFSAVHDLLDDLPTTSFAKWQIARLPEFLTESILTDSCINTCREGTILRRDEPAFTIRASAMRRPITEPKAFLVGDQFGNPQTSEQRRLDIRQAGDPACVIRSGEKGGAAPMAFLQMTGNTQLDNPTGTGVLRPRSPANTVCSNSTRNARAFIVDCHGSEQFGLTTRDGEERFFTVTGSADKRPARAWLEAGRVVSMSVRCLSRFQSVPDSYVLPVKNKLACEVIGNAVPCLLYQRIAESMRDALM